MPERKTSPENGAATRVSMDDRQVLTSYANAFQTRFTEMEFVLSCGLALAEKTGDEEILAVRIDRRIVMTPATAARLHAALGEALAQWRKSHGFGGSAD
ncbi:MAG: DUF3467 domain-containing protein [Desulfovibrionaceae bacterium]|nr:DUF3467 domain-containing protein [Desulfovibrionaceae bacterium]